MAFKPAGQKNVSSTPRAEFDPTRKYPEPKAGSRPARISLIVDLGVQEREDFEDPKTGEVKPQKPCHQLAVFADLVNDNVDYGGQIGMAQYRLGLNKVFQGKFEGINFTAVPPRDADGNMIKNKPWTLHPANLLTKIAKAIDRPEVIETMDAEQLLDVPFMLDVEVKKTPAKDNKKNDAGEPIIYTNVNFKGAAKVPMVEDEDGNEVPLKVKPLSQPALCVTFDNARKEDIKFIRGNILQKIKIATNYEGSQMQRAILAYEADPDGVATTAPVQETPKPAAKAPAKKAPVVDDDFDENIPF